MLYVKSTLKKQSSKDRIETEKTEKPNRKKPTTEKTKPTQNRNRMVSRNQKPKYFGSISVLYKNRAKPNHAHPYIKPQEK